MCSLADICTIFYIEQKNMSADICSFDNTGAPENLENGLSKSRKQGP